MKDKTLIFDMGGVLMDHNIPGCIKRFKEILGENYHRLGLGEDGEGKGLMDKFEKGLIDEDEFVSTILNYSREGTAADEIISAWNLMHGGIPEWRISFLHTLKDEGYTLFLLSNSNTTHWKHICDNYNLDGIFKGVFLSFEEHCSKPDKNLFRIVQQKIGTPAKDFIFIDDLKANRDAAERLGWSVCCSIEELQNKFLPKYIVA